LQEREKSSYQLIFEFARNDFERIEQLENDPEGQGKPLRNELSDLLSVMIIGQRYRIIYKVVNEELIVVVVAVGINREGDRSDICRIVERPLRSGLMTFWGNRPCWMQGKSKIN
jgi:mRNA interferase RelE/StbE